MLTDTVKSLKSHKSDLLGKIASLQAEINKVDEAINALSSVGGESTATVSAVLGKTRNISAAGIARIRAAQKARWAKFKKNGGGETKASSAGRSKPNFSAAGIARIRAAQKARWAKYNAAKSASAKK